MRAVAVPNAPGISAGTTACIRDHVRGWTFPDLILGSDVEVVVTFELKPSPFAAAER